MSLAAFTLALGEPERALALLGDGPARAATERAVRSFLFGARSFDARASDWGQPLQTLAAEQRCFAWEGVGLAATLSELGVEPVLERHREQAAWIFVGVGWALALRGECPAAPSEHWSAAHGELAWTVLDGLGFASTLMRRRLLAPRSDWFDQGVGRALYFIHAGQPDALGRVIDAMDSSRQAALWQGVGIASVVAGGLDSETLERLQQRGGTGLAHGRAIAPTPCAASEHEPRTRC
jgi:hypothetical protein